MCTSFTYEDADGKWYLSRTMDFTFELGGRPVVIPRGWHFKGGVDGVEFNAELGFVGAGRNVGQYFTVDGVNEAGFGAATLYFTESKYSDAPVAGKTNLASYELVSYLLGHFHTVGELRDQLDSLNIVAVPNAFMGNIVVPLHWIVADDSGDCAVLEMENDGLQLYDNPVGVMTNSPDFTWHVKNLNNYAQLRPTQAAGAQYGNLAAQGFGAGTGAVGLPGDYTSVSRFVRMAFLRQNGEKVSGQAAAVNTLSHLMNSVDIPRGVKVMEDGGLDYSQYRGYSALSDRTYFMQPYDDQTITKVQLTEELLNADEPTEFPLAHVQQFVEAN
ncbi:MAG: choloylglycine hydrolase family protein [Lacticaseibacillus songhuajiangensis]|nr:choloylglycine hydrolase family protein [Lacticaseibacillus songhuajiangensis]